MVNDTYAEIVRREEERVKRSVVSNLEEMESIRQACIFEKNVSSHYKELYLTHVGELSIGLNEIASLNIMSSKISDNVKSISDAIMKNKSLIDYDPLQNDVLKDSPQIQHALNELLLAISEDRFFTTKENYHIFQAIKSSGQITDKKYRSILQSSITPMQMNLEIQSDSFWKRFGAFFIGETYNIEKVDNSTLKIKNDITLESLSALISKLEGKGYESIRLDVPTSDVRTLTRKYSDAKRTYNETYNNKRSSNHLVEVEIPLPKSEDTNHIIDPAKYFEEFRANHSLDSDIANITSSNKADKLFAARTSIYDYFNKFDPDMSQATGLSIEKTLDEDASAVIFSNVRKIDGFTKYSLLAYKGTTRNPEEFLLTMIISDYQTSRDVSREIPKDASKEASVDGDNGDNLSKLSGNSNIVLSVIKEVILNRDGAAAKAESLANEFKPNYIRLRRFNGESPIKEFGGLKWYD